TKIYISSARACARRNSRGHGSESASRSSEKNAAALGAAHGHRILRGKKSFRSARHKGCGCRSERPLKNDRGESFQGRERHSLARKRAALRTRRNPIA